MNALDFARLFRALLATRAPLDTDRIEQMGLLAVKIAQMYAVRSDLLPFEKCAQLSRLLQHVEPMPAAQFAARWRELAPEAFLKALEKLNPQPLASASLGQVHRATLRDGRRVVVKFLRREVREEFLSDVRRARRLLRLAVLVYPKLGRLADPLGTLEAVERQTIVEMDFLAEPRGAARLARLASERDNMLPHLKKLHLPVYWPEFSHERFLVSEFIEGRTLNDWLESGKLPYRVLLDLFRIHGYFLFVRGEFHGDLHPGNIIWRDEKFWLLDNGNIDTVPAPFGRGLFRMMVLLGEGDFLRAARQVVDLSTIPLTSNQTLDFQSNFVALYRGFAGRAARQVSLTRQMMQTVKLAVSHGIAFPPGAFPVIKSLMYLDGMVLRCNPDAQLLRDVARFADDFPDAASCEPGPEPVKA